MHIGAGLYVTLDFTPAPSKTGTVAAQFELKCAWTPFEEARRILDPESTPFAARVASQCRDGAASEGTCAESMSKH